jgi:tripartite-type tricarboxylate transporter receptor subunit TctC
MSHSQTRRPAPPVTALGYLRRRRVVTASLAAVASRQALAQGTWPDRPVRLVAALPAGSALDILGRALAPFLSARYGQPLVVDNRPGAGGNIAAAAVAQATDGHTLGLVINTPVTVARYVTPGLTFNPARNFTPVALLYRTPFVLAVPSSLPARTLPEFTAHVRARPGQLTYASFGAGSAPHLGMEELSERHGLRMEHAVYRGFPEMTLDLAAGRIGAALNTVFGALPAIQEGKVRALAVTSARRSPLFPEVPTVAEAGEPAAEMYGWVGVVGPADLPPARAQEIAGVLREAIATPAGRANLETQGAEFIGSTPDAFAEEIRRETARWLPVIDRLGLRVAN